LKEVRKEGEEQKKYNKNDEGEEEEEDDKDEDDEEEDENKDDDDGDEEEDEDDDEESLIYLDEDQYVQILREVFLKPSNSKPLQVQQQANQATITTLDEDRIKQMIPEAKQEVIREGRQTR
jgi:ABC-type Zn2+ transport system substrate-binding protein/surface adhesin